MNITHPNLGDGLHIKKTKKQTKNNQITETCPQNKDEI